MYITLQQFKDAVKDIKSEWSEGVNDSHTLAHYRGVCKGHFKKIEEDKK